MGQPVETPHLLFYKLQHETVGERNRGALMGLGRFCGRAAARALLLLLLAAVAFGDAPAGAAEAQRRAGSYWSGLSREQKTDLVLGIFDGFNLNENILGITLKNEYTICSEIMDSIMRQSDAYFADMPAGRIVSGLDAFYAERKNRNIPISWGVWVVVRKNRRDATLPQFLEELRNLYP